MNINKENKEKLIQEIDFVIAKLNDKKIHPMKRIYYFSGIHGLLNRVFNFQFDPTLVLLHNVLQHVYQTNSSNLGKLFLGKDPTIEFSENIFLKLSEYLLELKDYLNNSNNEIYKIIEKFSTIAYISTGNGNYLYERGKIKL